MPSWGLTPRLINISCNDLTWRMIKVTNHSPMRRSLLLPLIVIACLAVTCSKTTSSGSSRLEGKWKQVQYLISPGPVGTWQYYIGPAFYLTFHADGRFEASSAFLMKDYDRYSVISQSKMWLYNSSSSDSTQLSYGFTSGMLNIWLPCIEPCGIRLKYISK
jgi:hypothetical protein